MMKTKTWLWNGMRGLTTIVVADGASTTVPPAPSGSPALPGAWAGFAAFVDAFLALGTPRPSRPRLENIRAGRHRAVGNVGRGPRSFILIRSRGRAWLPL